MKRLRIATHLHNQHEDQGWRMHLLDKMSANHRAREVMCLGKSLSKTCCSSEFILRMSMSQLSNQTSRAIQNADPCSENPLNTSIRAGRKGPVFLLAKYLFLTFHICLQQEIRKIHLLTKKRSRIPSNSRSRVLEH